MNQFELNKRGQDLTGQVFLDEAKWECNLASLFIFVRITLIIVEVEGDI